MSKFKIKDKRTFGQKVKDFGQIMLFWRGRRKGIVHTRNVQLSDIRAVFFPKNFQEKYRYLGAMPWKEEGDIFEAMYPLVLAMDYEAKPKWCPRWFLRFLHLFGSDNSIVRVRNWRLHNLEKRLTKGIIIIDYKTKWTHYDLRISLNAPRHLSRLADAIEYKFYDTGRQDELEEQIKAIDPEAKIIRGNVSRLEEQLKEIAGDKCKCEEPILRRHTKQCGKCKLYIDRVRHLSLTNQINNK